MYNLVCLFYLGWGKKVGSRVISSSSSTIEKQYFVHLQLLCFRLLAKDVIESYSLPWMCLPITLKFRRHLYTALKSMMALTLEENPICFISIIQVSFNLIGCFDIRNQLFHRDSSMIWSTSFGSLLLISRIQNIKDIPRLIFHVSNGLRIVAICSIELRSKK